jgi:inhibitor of Bruton tyrosine kinase
MNDPVASVALGQDHTIAVTKSGAVYTWGSNQHGQLGYVLDLTNKDNVQKVPRKIISTLKRIDILGVAASSLHSVCFSQEDLYTWGLNRGQLGYSSGDDGPIQGTPKKVATLQAPVEMVTAIDNATICLLKTKVVQIFANGGHFRVTYFISSNVINF